MPRMLHVSTARDLAARTATRSENLPSLAARSMTSNPPCLIRSLTERDLPAIERMLRALDVASRCARFGWASSDDALTIHAGSMVTDATHLIGAFAFGELHGLVEMYHNDASRDAEVAIVVSVPCRRRGFGRALLAGAAAWAEQNGLASVHLIFSRDNWPMRRLAAAADARLDITLDEIRATIELANAIPISAMRGGLA